MKEKENLSKIIIKTLQYSFLTTTIYKLSGFIFIIIIARILLPKIVWILEIG